MLPFSPLSHSDVKEMDEDCQFVIDEFHGYYDDLLSKMWEYAKRSGIKVREDLFH